eukprot:CAMPEP_0118941870 /NCGR_PEP_ID=MMETSP1169-20130426/34869_1 /TAXON_ID=36882 /ORGANISM="Pyramimonas obovata, Strain CCMP722" /LENGTH=497 /DNA_ID=CAMNT_0006886747 /DNA_START=126 /DNA_END=1616 /DNA_ORIENTATION=+
MASLRPPPLRLWNHGAQSDPQLTEANRNWQKDIPLLVAKQEQVYEGATLPKVRGPATDVLSQFRDLYSVNMAKTRRSISLSFAPTKPWTQKSPSELLPILLPKDDDPPCRRLWHWVAFALVVVGLMLLGVYVTAKVETVTQKIVVYAQSLNKLEPLPQRKRDWLETEQEQIQWNLTTASVEGEEIHKLTKYIVSPAEQKDPRWKRFSLELADEMVGPHHKHHGGPRVLFVGDFFETYRGTRYGGPCAVNGMVNNDCTSTRIIVQKEFQTGQHTYSWLATAFEGETTQNLLWRINAVEGFNSSSPIVCVINVGMSDLEGGRDPEEVAAGLRAVLHDLQENMPTTYMLFMGLLPRADDVWAVEKDAWETRQKAAAQLGQTPEILRIPFDESRWYEPIFRVNRWMEKIAHDSTQQEKPIYPPVAYVDCGASLLVPGQRRVNAPPRRELPQNLMHEYHHPSPEGHARVAACLHNEIDKINEAFEADRKSEAEVPMHETLRK